MSNVKRISTTVGVYSALLAAYDGQLNVYSSYSNPDGRAYGGGGAEGEMCTLWGFKDGNIPLVEAQSRFDLTPWYEHGTYYVKRTNERHEYWLYVHEKGDEDET